MGFQGLVDDTHGGRVGDGSLVTDLSVCLRVSLGGLFEHETEN